MKTYKVSFEITSDEKGRINAFTKLDKENIKKIISRMFDENNKYAVLVCTTLSNLKITKK